MFLLLDVAFSLSYVVILLFCFDLLCFFPISPHMVCYAIFFLSLLLLVNYVTCSHFISFVVLIDTLLFLIWHVIPCLFVLLFWMVVRVASVSFLPLFMFLMYFYCHHDFFC
ncbi:hypothetical protein DsansV1_C04g0036761 [Dioscorea sansibarensis]